MGSMVYIFGAHSRAQTLAAYLQYLYSDIEVEAYLYDNAERNPEIIGEIPVICLDKFAKLNTTNSVYIGTRGIYHTQIAEKLKKNGFKEIYPVTVEMDLRLRNAFLKKYFPEQGKDFLKIDMLMENAEAGKEKTSIGTSITSRVYVVKAVSDRPLQKQYVLAPYEMLIQAGAALTKERLYPGILTDDIGDHISEKNRQYCELTALYWLWKHAREDIIGLVHYRRHFLLPENWEQIMRNNKVDVILPIPLYVSPSIAENYMERHDSSDWEYMMKFLEEQDPRIFQEAENFFKGKLYSPCNMFVMKREVLNELCEWLFPILNAVVVNGGEKKDVYQNRYPGFLSERLMTFYFERNRNRYKIIYCDKNFLI